MCVSLFFYFLIIFYFIFLLFLFCFMHFMSVILFFFFFQAEDGIRDHCVTGVQTCALPISGARFTPSPPDFQGPARAHRTPPEPRRFPRHGPLSRGEPIPGRPALHKEKRTLPGAPAGFSGIGRVTALDASRRPSPPLRIRDRKRVV